MNLKKLQDNLNKRFKNQGHSRKKWTVLVGIIPLPPQEKSIKDFNTIVSKSYRKRRVEKKQSKKHLNHN